MNPTSKKTWKTPSIEAFGSMQEKTAENAKLPGTFDGDPFEDCPPGQVLMGDICVDGSGGVS